MRAPDTAVYVVNHVDQRDRLNGSENRVGYVFRCADEYTDVLELGRGQEIPVEQILEDLVAVST